MKVTIIGWYGTETIGDRAILAGLCHLFSESFGDLEVRLGCLGTLLSERTIDEDFSFFNECANGRLANIHLFDSRKKTELDAAIAWADIVSIGGGPLMEIEPMYMLLYALEKAKKRSKKCVVAGCGMGPFRTEGYKSIAAQIVDISDLTIFRDCKSQELYNETSLRRKGTLALIDPAAIATLCYLDKHSDKEKGEYVAVNFREPPIHEYDGLNELDITFFSDILKEMAQTHEGREIRLVPMHTFEMGGDDRYFLNKVARLSQLKNVNIDNRPLSLEETMDVYHRAFCCIGMRFHAILLQTILNGRNFILDYTDPEKGKIINLLNQLSIKDVYCDKYVSLVDSPKMIDFDASQIEKVEIDKDFISALKNKYISSFRSLL